MYFLVDRVGNAPTTSRMSSEHSTFELTVHFFQIVKFFLSVTYNLGNNI